MQNKKPSMGREEVWILSGTAHSELLSQAAAKRFSLAMHSSKDQTKFGFHFQWQEFHYKHPFNTGF